MVVIKINYDTYLSPDAQILLDVKIISTLRSTSKLLIF